MAAINRRGGVRRWCQQLPPTTPAPASTGYPTLNSVFTIELSEHYSSTFSQRTTGKTVKS